MVNYSQKQFEVKNFLKEHYAELKYKIQFVNSLMVQRTSYLQFLHEDRFENWNSMYVSDLDKFYFTEDSIWNFAEMSTEPYDFIFKYFAKNFYDVEMISD